MAIDKKLEIQITARNGAAQAFQQVSSEAAKLGTTVQSSSAQASAAFETLRQHAVALASLLTTTVVRGLQDVAAAGEALSQSQRQLRTAIEDTGASYEQYAASIEKVTAAGARFGLSDVTVTNALQTLVSVTGNAAASVGLMGLAEDIAAAKHMDLASAAQLVGRVFDGNVGILKRYGIIVDANTTSTQALAILQERYAGQAAASATTLSRFTAEVQNITGAVGQALGPFAGLITLLPGISVGMQAAIGAGGVLVDMFRAQKAAALEAATALEAESVAAEGAAAAGVGAGAAGEAGLLASLAGPAGIVAAIAAAGAGIYLLTRHTNDYAGAADAAAKSTNDLNVALAQKVAGGGDPTGIAALTGIRDSYAAAAKAGGDAASALTLAQKQLIQLQGDLAIIGTSDVAAAQAKEAEIKSTQDLIATLQKSALASADITAMSKEIQDLFNMPGVDPTKVAAAVKNLDDQFIAGTISAAQYKAGIDALSAGWSQFSTAVATTDAATNKLLTNLDKITTASKDKWAAATDPLKDIPAMLDHIDTSFDASAQNIQKWADQYAAIYKTNLVSAAGDPAKIAAATAGYVAQITALDLRLTQAEQAAADAATAASDAMANINAQMDYGAAIAADATTKYNEFAQSLNRVSEAAHHGVTPTIAPTAAQGALPRGGFIDPFANSFPAAVSSANATRQVGTEFANMVPLIEGADRGLAKFYDDAIKGSAQFLTQLGQVPTFLQAIASLPDASYAAKIASGAVDATAQLADFTRIVIDNTNAIAQNSDKLFKWADDLIGAEGVASKLDDLVNKGKITGQSGVFTGTSEYAQAQQAYNAIAKDNVRVQEAMLVIQAKQAPLLAELADKQAAYLEKIEAMKPAQQLAALGFMDANEAMKAQSTIALAAAAAQGKLGDEGEKAAGKVIAGAVAADPVLGAMLEQMGLIKVGADGTITLNMKGFESTQTAIDTMTNAVNALIDLLKHPITIRTEAEVREAMAEMATLRAAVGNLPRETTLAVGAVVSGDSDVTGLNDDIGNLPAHTAPEIAAIVSGRGDVDGLLGSINALYSRQIFIDTIVTTTYVGPPPGQSGPVALHGGIMGYASGGVVARLAEAGPELLDFPSGRHGYAASDGLYAVPRGTFVHTAPASKGKGQGGGPVYNYYGANYITPATGNLHAEINRSALLRDRRG